MAKTIRPIVGSVTKAGKKAYVVVDGVNRLAKKIYTVVGEVLKQCWSSAPTVTYSNTGVTLPNTYSHMLGNNKYIMSVNYTYSSGELASTGSAYDVNTLTHTYISSTNASQSGSTTTNGTYAILAVGYNGYSYYPVICLWDTSLTRTSISTGSGRSGAGSKIANYGLITPGQTYASSSSYSYSSIVYAINETGTSSHTYMSLGRSTLLGCYNDQYAIFAGGQNNNTGGASTLNTVDAFNKDLVRVSATSLLYPTIASYSLATGGGIGEYATILGGSCYIDGKYVSNNKIEAYSKSLVKTTPIENIQLNLIVAQASYNGVLAVYGSLPTTPSQYGCLIFNNAFTYTTQAFSAGSNNGNAATAGNNLFFDSSKILYNFKIID